MPETPVTDPVPEEETPAPTKEETEALLQMNLRIIESNARLVRERFLTALLTNDSGMVAECQQIYEQLLVVPVEEAPTEVVSDFRDLYCAACGMDKDVRGICTNPLCRAHSLGETLWALRKEEKETPVDTPSQGNP